MKRRQFLSNAAASSAAFASSRGLLAMQSQTTGKQRECYELRKYFLEQGPQQKLTDSYLAEAFIPALNRLGIQNVGAFSLDIGPETPTTYLLIPCNSLETLVTTELRLAHDDEYQRRGAAFLNAPAAQPAYRRMESSLMIAFEGWPKLTLPPATAQKGPRVFQLRTYESPSNRDHRVKVDMFHKGEFDIFEKAGFWRVFFGDTMIGPRLPNLTYMLSFPDASELNAKWRAFRADPDWKKLSAMPTYAFEPIVSNITNLVLNPTSYSQI
jgi:hypothetical protein